MTTLQEAARQRRLKKLAKKQRRVSTACREDRRLVERLARLRARCTGLRAAAARAEAVLGRAAAHPMGRAARDAQNALDLVGRAAGDAAHARLAARDGPLRHAEFAARDPRLGQGAFARLGGPLPRAAVGQVRVLRRRGDAAGHAEAQGPAPVRALLAAGHARGRGAARRRVAGALRPGADAEACASPATAFARARTPLAPLRLDSRVGSAASETWASLRGMTPLRATRRGPRRPSSGRANCSCCRVLASFAVDHSP